MTIKEYDYKPDDYKPEPPKPKEHAEAGKEKKNCLFTDELAQCELLDFISGGAEDMRIAVSDLENGFASFDGTPLIDVKRRIDSLVSLVRTMDAVYSQLNQNYKNAARETYQTFCVDNLRLRNMLERKLSEGMGGE